MVPEFRREDFYSLEERNNRKTLLMVFFYLILLGVCGLTLDMLWGFFPYPVFTGIATGFALVQTFVVSTWGGQIIAGSLDAKPLASFHEFPYKRALNVVQEVSIACGEPVPRVYVIPEPFPNAMVMGTKGGDACLCLTTGLIKMMDRGELQAVVAHEFGHILAGDSRLMMFMVALFGAVTLLSDFTLRTIKFAFIGRERRNLRNLWPILLLGLIISALSPVIATLITYSVSRFREYAADSAGARITRNPLALASALEKIKHYMGPVNGRYGVTSPAFFADFYRKDMAGGEKLLDNLTNTHPPIERRIAILKKMAGISPQSKLVKNVVGKMPCPSCGHPLREIKTKSQHGGVLILDQCDRCGGIWFDRYELSRAGEGTDLMKLIDVEKFKQPSQTRRGKMACPRCLVALKQVRDPAFPAGIILTRCELCGGVWLNVEEVRSFFKWRRKKFHHYRKMNEKGRLRRKRFIQRRTLSYPTEDTIIDVLDILRKI